MRMPLWIAALTLIACTTDDADPSDTIADETDGTVGDTGTTVDTTDIETVEDAGADVADAPTATTTWQLQGTATGEDEALDTRVECTLQLLVFDVIEGADGWSGFASGEAIRTVYPDTRRFEFAALVAGPGTLVETHPGEAEVRLVGDQPDDAIPFWRALEVIHAVRDPSGSWFGEFACAPLGIDLGGYRDDAVTVTGSFTLERVDEPIEEITVR